MQKQYGKGEAVVNALDGVDLSIEKAVSVLYWDLCSGKTHYEYARRYRLSHPVR